MTWRVFMVEQTELQNRYLRRFTYGERKPCPEAAEGVGHDHWQPLDCVENPVHDVHDFEERQELATEAAERDDKDFLRKATVGDLWPHDDERWPEACARCGYEFEEEDEFQLHQKDLWTPTDPRLEEEHGRFELANAPVGAMWHAWWMGGEPGPDGLYLVVKLPDGWEWELDGGASNGPQGWERVGKPPELTVSPSIASPGYHGFLVAGELTDDVEGRTYDG